MTVVLERYIDSCGVEANIEQDKYETSYKLVILTADENRMATVLYRNIYTTREAARRAMRRRLSAPITRTFKR